MDVPTATAKVAQPRVHLVRVVWFETTHSPEVLLLQLQLAGRAAQSLYLNIISCRTSWHFNWLIVNRMSQYVCS